MTFPKKWILAIDDDPDDLFWIQEAVRKASLGDFEYQLVKASSAQEARELLEGLALGCLAGEEIIVFSDINMPSESGLQLLEWLKSHPQFHEIPVVMVSSFDRRTEIIRAFELGAVACMFKPPESKAVKGLLKTINQLAAAKSCIDPVFKLRNTPVTPFNTIQDSASILSPRVQMDT